MRRLFILSLLTFGAPTVSAQRLLAIRDVTVIDGTGKYLVPGFWDMHAHVSDNDGMLNLAAGVTTVRVHVQGDPYDSDPKHDIEVNTSTSRVRVDP